MESNFKKKKIKYEFINWYQYVINDRKDTKGDIYDAIHQYAKANNKYMKDYDKNKESSNLKYLDVNNLCGWTILQKFMT